MLLGGEKKQGLCFDPARFPIQVAIHLKMSGGQWIYEPGIPGKIEDIDFRVIRKQKSLKPSY